MLAAGLLAALSLHATPSPAPSPSPSLKTIVNIRSTPFCTAIAQHFNAAVTPMLANDSDFTRVDVQLQNLNDVFRHPDYQSRYYDVRLKLMKYDAVIQTSLPAIQRQIDLLRNGETLTTDKAQAAQLHQIAEKLQLAYNKQMQLAIDVGGVVRAMMDYEPPENLDWAQGELADQSMPKDMRDIKSYLRYDGQRDVIDRAENAAADSAIDLVSRHCANP